MLAQLIILSMAMGFLITVLLSPFFIPYLRKLKFGQSIREEGPKSHQKKSGTPTMGGVMILVSVVLTTIVMSVKFNVFNLVSIALLITTLGYGLIGFLDDYIKVVKKRNLGLTAKQKIFGQILIAIVFSIIHYELGISTKIGVPGTEIFVDLKWLYPLFILLMFVGTSNAVNLTDGLDGLLAGTSAIAFGAYGVLAWNQSQFDVVIFSVAIAGASLGFLVFNAHPAKVFMGDTGSLALGGALAAIAIFTKLELLLVILGGVFVLETLSVIIQVISYQSTGRRVFLMSPLHHHYELKGWSEWRVVVTFWLVGFLFSILGIYIEVWL
jgi:phospho-N-acetylmuramoyl-pentapeptide-transferase